MAVKQKNLSGRRFGRWLVNEEVKATQGKYSEKTFWSCKCDCGTTKLVKESLLIYGSSLSCGCTRLEKLRSNPPFKKHGLSHKHPLYKVWKTMRQRCLNPNNKKFHRYGGRGIKVCERWNDFSLFVKDVGESYSPGLTLDRKDNDGDYEPNNVRWVPNIIQANNRGSYRRDLVIVESEGFDELSWKDWKEISVLKEVVENLLKTINDKPLDVLLYRWVNDATVVLELVWGKK